LKALSRKRARTLERERKAIELRARGRTEVQIAEELGMSQGGVSKLLQRVEDDLYRQNRARLNREKVMTDLRYEAIIRDGWAAWERSKNDAVKKVLKRAGANEKEATATVQQTLETKGQSGDPRHLKIVLEALEGKRKLWGLDAPVKVTAVREPSPFETWADEDLLQRAEEELRAARLQLEGGEAIDAASGEEQP